MPQRGDVVVFMHPQEPGRVMIKRLIGLPGDVIEVRDSHLIINGEPVALSDGEPLQRLAYQRGVEFAIRYEETLPGGMRHPIDQFPHGATSSTIGGRSRCPPATSSSWATIATTRSTAAIPAWARRRWKI